MHNIKLRIGLQAYKADHVTIKSRVSFTLDRTVPFIPRSGDMMAIGTLVFRVSNAIIQEDGDFVILCSPYNCEDESELMELFADFRSKYALSDVSAVPEAVPGYYLIYRIITQILVPDMGNNHHQLIVSDLLRLMLEAAGVESLELVTEFQDVVIKHRGSRLAKLLMIWSDRVGLGSKYNDGLMKIEPSHIADGWKRLSRPSLSGVALPPALQ